MKALALVVSLLVLALASQHLYRVRGRRTLLLLVPKFLGSAWAHYVALAGFGAMALGLFSEAYVPALLGFVATVLAADYVRRVTQPRADFARAFGPHWQDRVAPDAERRMLSRRLGFRVPRAPEPRWSRDIPFWTLPDSQGPLLCDVWQPPAGVPASGMAVVYLHGSAWYLIDKDMGTRPMFRHLAAQGHVIVDVAYRLCPETDFVGMVADAKHAVAWIKAHSAEYAVDPGRVVLMGGSAGGHIALLAAYSAGVAALTPDDLKDVSTSVAGVVSYYGITDLREYEADARVFEAPPPLRDSTLREAPGAYGRLLFGSDLPPDRLPPLPQHRQMMRQLVGGLPEEVPERFALASPIVHASAKSPATLLLYGEHDHIVAVASARRLRDALMGFGVPTVYVEFPGTGHAFDLIVPSLFAPAGQAALYELERFLACLPTMSAQKPERAAAA